MSYATSNIGGFVTMELVLFWPWRRTREILSSASMRTTYPLVLLYGLCVYSCIVANLANFLFTPRVPIFLGTVFLLRPLVSADTRSGALISRA